MLWIISTAFFIWCFILEHELQKIKKIKNVLLDSNKEKDEALKNLQNSCDYWQKEGNKWYYARNAAVEQAKAFQSVAKTMEKHLAAERSRADRLARELEKASDEILLLKSKYLAPYKEKDAQKEAEAGQSKKLKKEDLDTEWANILNYNGSDDGQVDV